MRSRHTVPGAPFLAGCLALGILLLATGGCALKYREGLALENQGRWEEAMQAYREAVIDDPDDPEYRNALARAEKVVARDNLERYRAYLSQKQFHKAYARLRAAASQDPELAAVQAELAKWDRVLVSGQVRFTFETAQTSFSLADQITLIVRVNTPNPGQTIDAEIDLATGIFFAEDLLYDRPNELLTLYSVNSIGVNLVHGRTRIKQFTSREYQRFVNIRTPVVDEVTGLIALQRSAETKPIDDHRARIPSDGFAKAPTIPPSSPRYSLQIQGDRILVQPAEAGTRADFTPRYLYLNKAGRRVLVDFGRYEVQLDERTRRWTLRRLELGADDYFGGFSRNIALKPYFFYREGVFTFVPAGSG